MTARRNDEPCVAGGMAIFLAYCGSHSAFQLVGGVLTSSVL